MLNDLFLSRYTTPLLLLWLETTEGRGRCWTASLVLTLSLSIALHDKESRKKDKDRTKHLIINNSTTHNQYVRLLNNDLSNVMDADIQFNFKTTIIDNARLIDALIDNNL